MVLYKGLLGCKTTEILHDNGRAIRQLDKSNY